MVLLQLLMENQALVAQQLLLVKLVKVLIQQLVVQQYHTKNLRQ